MFIFFSRLLPLLLCLSLFLFLSLSLSLSVLLPPYSVSLALSRSRSLYLCLSVSLYVSLPCSLLDRYVLGLLALQLKPRTPQPRNSKSKSQAFNDTPNLKPAKRQSYSEDGTGGQKQ